MTIPPPCRRLPLLGGLISRAALSALIPTGMRAAAIIAIGCTVALIANAVHPMGLPLLLGRVPHSGIPVWVWDEVAHVSAKAGHGAWHAGSAIILDARDRKDYAERHVPGAINLPYHDFTNAYATVKKKAPSEGHTLIYCYGSGCGLSMRLAKRLLALGYTDLNVLRGGFAAWRMAGYETIAGDKPAQAKEEADESASGPGSLP